MGYTKRFSGRALLVGLGLLVVLLAGCSSSGGQAATSPTDTPGGASAAPTVTDVPTSPGQTSIGPVDACGWFSLNDASRVLGGPANPPTVQKTSSSSLCAYAAPSNGETMLFVVQQGANATSRYQLEQKAADSATGYQAIAGLGDSAFWTPIDGVVALKGQTLFTIQVLHIQSQAAAALLPAEEQLLRVALGHVS